MTALKVEDCPYLTLEMGDPCWAQLFPVPLIATSPAPHSEQTAVTFFPVKLIRGLWRLLVFIANIVFSLTQFALFLGWMKSVAWRTRWLGQTCSRGLKAINLKLTVHGYLEPSAEMIVTNHLSYLDILVLSKVLHPVFVSKSEVKSWPLFGFFAKLVSTIFIERDNRSKVGEQAGEIERAVTAGATLALFPEGATTNGSDVLKFRSSLFEPVVKNKWLVVPAAIVYRCRGGDPANRVCWWGDTSLTVHLMGLLLLDEIYADVLFGQPVRPAVDRKQFAARLQVDVTQLKTELQRTCLPV